MDMECNSIFEIASKKERGEEERGGRERRERGRGRSFKESTHRKNNYAFHTHKFNICQGNLKLDPTLAT